MGGCIRLELVVALSRNTQSAPAYQSLLKVTAIPLLYGCVYSIAKDKCSCYTQQATPYPASKAYCLETVKNHRFNPYYERFSAQVAAPQLAAQAAKLPDKMPLTALTPASTAQQTVSTTQDGT